MGWLILEVQLVNPNPNSLLSDQIVFLLPLLVWSMQSSVRNWMKGGWWVAFVIVPWALFAIYLQGKEPYQAASGLALVFTLWFGARLLDHWVRQHRVRQNSLIEEAQV